MTGTVWRVDIWISKPYHSNSRLLTGGKRRNKSIDKHNKRALNTLAIRKLDTNGKTAEKEEIEVELALKYKK